MHTAQSHSTQGAGHRAGRSGRPGSQQMSLLLPTAAARPPRLGGSRLGLWWRSARAAAVGRFWPETAPARPCPTCSPSSCSRVDLGWEGQRRADHLSCRGKGFGVGVGLPPLAPRRPHHSDSGMGLSYWDSSPSSPTPQSLCPGPPASRLT